MIPTIVNGVSGLLGIAVVLHHQTSRIRIRFDANLAGHAHFATASVVTLDLNCEERIRPSHRPGSWVCVLKVRNGKRRLSLAEAFENRQARVLFPEIEQVGVERFARRRRVLQRRQIILVKVGLHHEAIHGWRAAQRRDLVFLDQTKNLVGMIAVEVVREHARFHQPLAIVLAPNCLAPTRIGNREMNAVGIDIVPMLGSGKMPDCVRRIVQNHLRVARRTAREVHQHGVGSKRFHALEFRGGQTNLGVEVKPALTLNSSCANAIRPAQRRTAFTVFDKIASFLIMWSETAACAVDEEQLFNRRAIAHSPVDDVGNIADAGCDDRLDGCAVQAILKVVFLEHI